MTDRKPATAITLRTATRADVPVLAAMSRRLVETGLRWRYTPTRVAALLADAETATVVAVEGSNISGYAVMSFGDDEAHLVLLCVWPMRQRLGIARRLHAWLLASARVAGMAAVRLEARADNAAALACYRAFGYEPAERIAGYYDGRVDAQRFVLRLRPPA